MIDRLAGAVVAAISVVSITGIVALTWLAHSGTCS